LEIFEALTAVDEDSCGRDAVTRHSTTRCHNSVDHDT